MGSIIDEMAKALASGASRRAAVGGALAGATGFLPWTTAAKNGKKRRKERRRAIKRYLEYCEFWCEARFDLEPSAIQPCITAAESGQGPCYSAEEKGPGHFCLRVKKCGDHKYCCPEVLGPNPVTDGSCCAKGNACAFINGTVCDGLSVN